MENFEYANPKTLQEAASLLGPDAAVLAGGTDLLSLMKDYIVTPKRVVGIRNIKELGGVSKSGKGLRIGATATFDELLNNNLVRSDYPAIHQAVHGVASPQIRNMGTAGGDLCQRPRCWYYRTGNGLLGMMNGKSLIPAGQNRYHAIFPEPPAYFVSASSLGPALIALGATIKIYSPSGTREVPAEKFFVVPQGDTAREIALQPNEIVTEILIPSASGLKSATYEIREREAIDWPLATASVVLKTKGNNVESAKIVLGHVGPVPRVATEAAAMLAGKSVTPETAEQVAGAAVAGAKPLSDNEYKIQLAKVAVKRALLTAVGKSV